MKNFRKSMLTVCGMLLLGCAVSGGAALLGKAEKNAAFAEEIETVSADFGMIGASIRYDSNEGGIRFGTKIKTSLYDEYVENGAQEMGILVLPAEKLEGELLYDTAYAEKAVTYVSGGESKWGGMLNGKKIEGFLQAATYIYNIPREHYNSGLVARAYVKTAEGSYVYSDSIERCIDEVAFAALQNETDEAKKEQLQAYISANDYTITYIKDGEELKRETHKYGETIVPDSYENYELIDYTEDNATVTGNAVYTYARALDNVSVAEFKKLLNDSPNGYFVLGKDLDFANAQTEGTITSFKGILDGRGYSIKNLSIHFDARDDGCRSYLFKENAGVIRNIGIRYSYYANGPDGLILNNKGTISNVFASVTVTNLSAVWNFGTIATINEGVIKNCVAELNFAEGVSATNLVGAISCIGEKESVTENCYAITNGNIAEKNLNSPCVLVKENAVIANNRNYETMADLAASATFDSVDGWESYWKVTDGKVVFGSVGEYTVLTQADAANFAAILAANPNDDYVLGSDIDFGGAELDGIGTFGGVFDGRGYALKNFNLKYNQYTSIQWSYAFIANNAGTIKNVAITYTLKGNNGHEAVINENNGTIENVFVEVKMESKGWANAALVGINKGTGIIKNVIAVLTKDESVSAGGLGAVVGADYNGTIHNAYGVCGDVIASSEDAFKTPYSEGWNNGSYVGNQNYTTMAELLEAKSAEFTEENGWNMTYFAKTFKAVLDSKNA